MWVSYRRNSVLYSVLLHELLDGVGDVVLGPVRRDGLGDAVVLGQLGEDLADVHGAVADVDSRPVCEPVNKHAIAVIVQTEMIQGDVLERVLGDDRGHRGRFDCDGAILWQVWQLDLVLLMSFAKPGQ